MKKSLRRASLVIIGAVLLTTLGINASDLMTGAPGRLSSLVSNSAGPCGVNETLVRYGTHALCVDIYEASPHELCPYQAPQSELDTTANLESGSCLAVSESNVIPWRYITYTAAKQMCARSGKRLLSAEEWYQIAVGLADTTPCALNNREAQPSETGTVSCVTPTGIHDLVGNVWEWVDDTITEGKRGEQIVPDSGYVALVDGSGFVIKTSSEPQTEYGADYAWTNRTGIRGLIRGGFYGSGSDGGVFAQNASVPLDFATAGVGFRCARDVL